MAARRWNNAWVLNLRMTLLFGPLLVFGMLMIWPWALKIVPVWTDGRKEDYLVGGLEVAGAGVYLPAPAGHAGCHLGYDGRIW